jgi:hypothetical protein
MPPLDTLIEVEKQFLPSEFGNSLARLATDIVAGHGVRKVSADTRISALSALRAATRRTLSANAAHRAAVATEFTADAAALRKSLAAGDAALGAAVQSKLAAARLDLSAKREIIAANAKALRHRLGVSRRGAFAAVTAFRAEVRSEQAAAAKALAASLGQFVAGVRSDTAAIQDAVRSQFRVTRAAWGHATTTAITAAPAPPNVFTSVPVAPPIVRAEAVPAAVLNANERRWVPR